MNKKLSIMLLVILIAGRLSAQSASPSVLASAGDYFSNSTFSLSWTFGEMTMVETLNGGSNILTQGFQQPFLMNVGVPVIPSPEVNKFNLFPNPTNGQFQVNYQLSEPGQLTFKIFNLLGQQVYNKSISQTAGINQTDFNIANLPQSMYFMETTFRATSGKQIISNQKFNVIF